MANVLIIYSDPASTDVPAIICDDAGHTVTFAQELEAAEALTHHAFDLVIAAVQKPLPVLRSIREARGKAPVIVIMTDTGGTDDSAMRAEGAAAIIFRPFSIQTLRRAISDLV